MKPNECMKLLWSGRETQYAKRSVARPRSTPSRAPAFLHFSHTPSRVKQREHAMLHASAAPAPCFLKNCDQDAAGQKVGIFPKWVWFGKGPGPAGGKGEVQQEGAQVQKKGSHFQKNCSKVRFIKSVQVQKKWKEVQKKALLKLVEV